MNGQEPLGGEALHICSPVSERDIQEKYKDGNEDEFAHFLFFFFFFFFWKSSSSLSKDCQSVSSFSLEAVMVSL